MLLVELTAYTSLYKQQDSPVTYSSYHTGMWEGGGEDTMHGNTGDWAGGVAVLWGRVRERL